MLSIPQLQKQFSNEQILMVLIARLHVETVSKEEVDCFIDTNAIDWLLFYKIITVHGVRAFSYAIIHKHDLKIENQLFEKLKNDAVLASFKSLHQLQFVSELTNTLSKMHIPVIPHKGVSLAALYYPSIGWREGSDIDLLVHPNHVRKIRNYFLQKDFLPKVDVNDRYLSYFIRYFKELVFTTPVNNTNISCSIEIQWRLLDPFLKEYASYDFFSPHIIEKEVCKKRIYGLSTTHNFLCLVSNHFVKDQLCSFKYVIDMACLFQKNGHELDGLLISKIVNKYAIAKNYYACVATISDLLGIQLPVVIQQKSVDHTLILGNALAYPQLHRVALDNFKALSLLYKYQDNFIEKLKFKFRVAFYRFIPNKTDLDCFPDKSIFQLFFLRFFRLMQKKSRTDL